MVNGIFKLVKGNEHQNGQNGNGKTVWILLRIQRSKRETESKRNSPKRQNGNGKTVKRNGKTAKRRRTKRQNGKTANENRNGKMQNGEAKMDKTVKTAKGQNGQKGKMAKRSKR